MKLKKNSKMIVTVGLIATLGLATIGCSKPKEAAKKTNSTTVETSAETSTPKSKSKFTYGKHTEFISYDFKNKKEIGKVNNNNPDLQDALKVSSEFLFASKTFTFDEFYTKEFANKFMKYLSKDAISLWEGEQKFSELEFDFKKIKTVDVELGAVYYSENQCHLLALVTTEFENQDGEYGSSGSKRTAADIILIKENNEWKVDSEFSEEGLVEGTFEKEYDTQEPKKIEAQKFKEDHKGDACRERYVPYEPEVLVTEIMSSSDPIIGEWKLKEIIDYKGFEYSAEYLEQEYDSVTTAIFNDNETLRVNVENLYEDDGNEVFYYGSVGNGKYTVKPVKNTTSTDFEIQLNGNTLAMKDDQGNSRIFTRVEK